jgi:hypothetical protein
MRTFFDLVKPSSEELAAQRFEFLYYGRRSWQEWNEITPRDREDFMKRLYDVIMEEQREKANFWSSLGSSLKGLIPGSR